MGTPNTHQEARKQLELFMTEQQKADFHQYGHFFVITPKVRYVYACGNGEQVVQLRANRGVVGPFEHRNVWGTGQPDGSRQGLYSALLTQLVWLSAGEGWARAFMHRGCTDGYAARWLEGAPPMKGLVAV